MDDCDVLIVGAGIAGASLAWRLACAGLRVRLLEREAQPGFHSTGRSAALFIESYGPPGVRALTRASRAFYLHPPAGFAAAPVLHPCPTLYVATPEQQPALRRLCDELASNAAQLTLLDAAQALALAPMLRPGLFVQALLDAGSYDIDVHTLLQGFLRGARAAGAALTLNVEPHAAVQQAGRWRVTLSNGASVCASVVVDAAGAWADQVAALFGAAAIGIEPRRRSAFTFRAPAGVDASGWPMVTDVDEHWYFKPDAGQLLGSPANADPTTPHDVQPEQLDIALGIDRIQQATTLEIRRPTATWAGLRSFVPDGEIVIGFDPACPGFFWLAALGGYGIQSAAGASLLAASLIQGAALPEDLRAHGVDPAVVSPARWRR
ncbi:MAG: FAD-binding oxidoreductase [Burkholderiaceae bacterium]|jgi:D-arginine dehydrogenase|nr:FAD-binding oxidoreductase [Burkholderiaceae bacterium]